MADDEMTAAIDLMEVEAELCRLPDISAVRIVADGVGRPVEVHVLAQGSKSAKQIVRDIQSVALASFGLDIDRRIVSVVQLPGNGAGLADSATAEATLRPRIVTLQVQTTGRRATFQITLALDGEERTGFAEGSIATSARARLVAAATLDALRQLEPAAEWFDVDTAEIVRCGAHDVAVVVLTGSDPSHECHLCGSAIVIHHRDEAFVRAVLDATNRRLPHLARHPEQR